MQKVYVGIDMGKRFSEVFAFSDQGEVLVEQNVETYRVDQWQALFDPLAERYELSFTYEIGPCYEWFHALLERFGEAIAINPGDFAPIRRSRKKTDKEDARKLAVWLRRGNLPSVFIADTDTRADRRLVAFRHRHSLDIARTKTSIRALLVSFRLDCPYKDIAGKRAQQWLRNEAPKQLDQVAQLRLKHLLEQLELYLQQKRELEQIIEERVERYGEEARRLRTIPGFGSYTILAVLSCIADVRRFESPKKLSSYFGVCGSIYQSGQVRVDGAMTKRGNKHVRWLLAQAIYHLHRRDRRARERYQRLRKKKPTGVARGAQMRWLSVIIWNMLTNKQDFNGHRTQQVA